MNLLSLLTVASTSREIDTKNSSHRKIYLSRVENLIDFLISINCPTERLNLCFEINGMIFKNRSYITQKALNRCRKTNKTLSCTRINEQILNLNASGMDNKDIAIRLYGDNPPSRSHIDYVQRTIRLAKRRKLSLIRD